MEIKFAQGLSGIFGSSTIRSRRIGEVGRRVSRSSEFPRNNSFAPVLAKSSRANCPPSAFNSSPTSDSVSASVSLPVYHRQILSPPDFPPSATLPIQLNFVRSLLCHPPRAIKGYLNYRIYKGEADTFGWKREEKTRATFEPRLYRDYIAILISV